MAQTFAGRVHLGYEIGSGEAVSIPVRHMAVTGQTQMSGKTTTLEALISRSGLRAIAFVTKRGEGSFRHALQISPYFQDRADWEFVRSILESTLREKMKFETGWISKACAGASSLADVRTNCSRLQEKSKRGLDQDMFMLLGLYLDKVVPLIASLPKSPELILGDGLNVMDLSRYPLELQMLVISSTLQEIYQAGDKTITIIPEAWEFVPEGRKTPVKLVVEKLVRKGASLRNFIWLDSQDLAAVDKLLLRACSVWLIGVQRESNEVKRSLENMHVSGEIKRQIRKHISSLELGQFFVAYEKELKRVYVQPSWMKEAQAEAVACGEIKLSDIPPGGREGAGPGLATGKEQALPVFPRSNDVNNYRQDRGADTAAEFPHARRGECFAADAGTESRVGSVAPVAEHSGPMGSVRGSSSALNEEEVVHTYTEDELFKASGISAASQHAELVRGICRALLPFLNQQSLPARPVVTIHKPHSAGGGENNGAEASPNRPEILRGSSASEIDVVDLLRGEHEAAALEREELIHSVTNLVLAKIRQDPVLIKLSQEVPTIEVAVNRRTIKADGATIFGKMATLIHEGWFQARRSEKELRAELVRRGMGAKTGGAFTEPLQRLVEMGFLYRCEGDMYELVPGAKSRAVTA